MDVEITEQRRDVQQRGVRRGLIPVP